MGSGTQLLRLGKFPKWRISFVSHCEELRKLRAAGDNEIQNLAMPDFILKCYRKYMYQLRDRLKKNKNELQENESSEFHFVSHLFPTNLSHLVPICKYIQHSCNIYNAWISSTPCIYLLCKILPLIADYCLKSLNRLVFVIEY